MIDLLEIKQIKLDNNRSSRVIKHSVWSLAINQSVNQSNAYHSTVSVCQTTFSYTAWCQLNTFLLTNIK